MPKTSKVLPIWRNFTTNHNPVPMFQIQVNSKAVVKWPILVASVKGKLMVEKCCITLTTFGQWYGSVGRAVASNSRGLWHESSHWQKFILTFTVSCIEMTKIRKKRPGMAHFFKKHWPPEGKLCTKFRRRLREALFPVPVRT